ncbi:hypothetical protein XENTR_v10018774 [Xenopus tropicalis]|nr:hypothetical protein XENTR_v10018774 [Xenopus tropicalis]
MHKEWVGSWSHRIMGGPRRPKMSSLTADCALNASHSTVGSFLTWLNWALIVVEHYNTTITSILARHDWSSMQ